MAVTAPYGSWKSPISADLILAGAVRVSQVQLDGDDIYWVEERPNEGGRHVIVRRTATGQILDVTPPDFSARTRVHEYGGGAYLACDGAVFFSNFADQRLYRQGGDGPPQPITPEGDYRYADADIDRARGRLVGVREDHTGAEAVNSVVALLTDGSAPPGVLVAGNDFYASPRVSPDGSRLAWLAWDHPNMPWDGCELWVAEFGNDGSLLRPRKVAGGPDESIFQPSWSPDGILYFVSDRSGWWNLYRLAQAGRVEPLLELEAEFGHPQWVFGTSTYGFQSARRLLAGAGQKGRTSLLDIDTVTRKWGEIETAYTEIGNLRVADDKAVFIGGSPSQPAGIIHLDIKAGKTEVLRSSREVPVDPAYISSPEAIEFADADGQTAHAFYYAPCNPDYDVPAGERPPLLVKSHGGPTSATSTSLNLQTQFWTSRGIAVVDVNYRGSSGYGRAYRKLLEGRWGIVDVDDCVNAARHLVERGLVDERRLAISGGSAGGYTTLCALTFRDTFGAGASHFGVSDLEALARDTHKFESRYLDRLIGPYPERRDLYLARSPINFSEQMSCPCVFFQGDEDRIVPPNQAETMVDALRRKGLPVAYVLFPGEQHGFRRAENIKRALEGELYFYSAVFGFSLAEPIEPLLIENL